MKTIRIYITGSVQGMFFRQFIDKTAKELNLKGFVRNLDDGRVEVVVEGRIEPVTEMIKRCKAGPRHSSVKNVEVHDMTNQGFDCFKVLSM